MNERLLLRLPHHQVVFTFPKVLRVFFRHERPTLDCSPPWSSAAAAAAPP
jgi:hypothetical protein